MFWIVQPLSSVLILEPCILNLFSHFESHDFWFSFLQKQK